MSALLHIIFMHNCVVFSFLNKMDVVRKENYSPTDDDILRCRVQTRGVFETKFVVNRVRFQ